MHDTQNIQALIENYKQVNKTLRNRMVFIGIVFLIVVGLFTTISRNSSKSWNLHLATNELMTLVESDSLKRDYQIVTSEINGLTFNPEIDPYVLRLLRHDVEKSNYLDKTPIFQLIDKIRLQQEALGRKSGDYQINVFGMDTSLSNWLYFIPIILLLLYHDMTLQFLYRKNLQKNIREQEVSSWMLGPELLLNDLNDPKTPLSRFTQILSTGIIAIILVMPVVPTALGAIYYIVESREVDIEPLLVVIQWLSLIIILIELSIIYYTENIFSVRTMISTWRNRTQESSSEDGT